MSGWPVEKLGAVTSKIGSGATPRGGGNVYQSQGTALIRSQNVLDNKMKLQGIARINQENADFLQNVRVHAGDVLINITGDSIARCSLVDPDILPARVNQHVAILRPTAGLDSRFLQKCLVSPVIKDHLLALSQGGGTRKALTKAQLESIEIPFPPLAEQQAVAEVLGTLDDKIAANARLATVSNGLAGALFEQSSIASEAVSDASELTINQLIESGALLMSDGYRTKRSELSGSGFRIIRVADIQSGVIRLESEDFVDEEFHLAIGLKQGIAGDLLLTTKGTVGRVAVVRELSERVVYSPQICFFRVLSNSLIERIYLRHWLESSAFLLQASHRMNNTDMAPYINLADIRSLRLALPPIERQRRIAPILQALDDQIGARAEESRLLAELRDTLLPALMSGKLRVKDAEQHLEEVL